MNIRKFLTSLLLATSLPAQTPVEVVTIQSKIVAREMRLPGEVLPYLDVPIHAKVTGFVKKINVDRGSIVKEGDILITLEAPEMQAHIAEAESKAQAIELQKAEMEAKLASVQSTYDSLKAASETPRVVAGNDLTVAAKNVDAARATVRSFDGTLRAAQSSIRSLKDLEKYLTITAPFDGVIVQRDV